MNAQLHRARYRLAPHIHACATPRHIVLLDLKRDEYLGFEAAEAKLLDSSIEGWPLTPISQESSSSERSARQNMPATERCAVLIAQMLAQGMLAEASDRIGQVRGTPSTHVAPQRALIEGYARVPTRIRTRDVSRFLFATGTARALLRWRSLEQVTRRVRNRNRSAQTAIALKARGRIDLLQRQVATFRRLCPLVFSIHNACLFDSLALSEFLAARGFYPNWIFGVATDPFGAHCWLQLDDVVVNDTVDHVQRFTQILVL